MSGLDCPVSDFAVRCIRLGGRYGQAGDPDNVRRSVAALDSVRHLAAGHDTRLSRWAGNHGCCNRFGSDGGGARNSPHPAGGSNLDDSPAIGCCTLSDDDSSSSSSNDLMDDRNNIGGFRLGSGAAPSEAEPPRQPQGLTVSGF